MTTKPKIVVLDAVALRENDMDWTALDKLSDNVTIYPHTLTSDLIERIGDADAVIINKGQVDEKVLNVCTNLKYIGITATGYDSLNIADCEKFGVTVTNVPGYSSESVAQQLFALLLEYATNVSAYSGVAKKGEWLGRINDINSLRPMIELGGKTLGIVGYGDIGSAVARIAKAFGMRVLCYSFSGKTADGIEFCDLDTLYAQSDILSLHCKHTELTDKIINQDSISKMKDGVLLCNVSRGRLIDDEAVFNALQNGKIAFYLADVLTDEPLTQNHPLIKCKNTIITPHVAWATKSSLNRLADAVIENMTAFYNGTPKNVVTNQNNN